MASNFSQALKIASANSVTALNLEGAPLSLKEVFAICLGLGSGINSIAQGSLPLYLFGSDGYGAVTGKMAAARLAVGAAAPFVFASAMQNLGVGTALAVNAALGVVGVIVFVVVATSTRRTVASASQVSDRLQ